MKRHNPDKSWAATLKFPVTSILFWLGLGVRVLAIIAMYRPNEFDGSLPMALISRLAIDFVLYVALLRFSRPQFHRITLNVWLNPLLISLSALPKGEWIALSALALFLSVHFSLAGQLVLSAVCVAASCALQPWYTLVVPIIALFIYHRDFLPTSFLALLRWTSILIACYFGFYKFVPPMHLPFIGLDSLTAASSLGFGVVVFWVFRASLSASLSPLSYFYSIGLVVLSSFLFVSRSPGILFGALPFILTAWSRNLRFSFAVKATLVLSSLGAFFIPTVMDKWFGVQLSAQAQLLLDGVMCGATVLNGCFYWYFCLRDELPIVPKTEGVIVGIAGDSGSGKDHLSQVMVELFGEHATSVVRGDDYHRWERGDASWNTMTHLNPKANHLMALAHHVRLLRRGVSVFQRHYDHNTGKFQLPSELKPSRTLIIQGLHTLYLRGMRQLYDVRIFLAPDPRVRLSWKVARDTKERGHSADKVIASVNNRLADSLAHIDPQGGIADWVIEYFPVQEISAPEIASGEVFQLGVRHIFWNDSAVTEVLEALSAIPGLDVSLGFESLPHDRVIATIQGTISQKQIECISDTLFPNLRQRIHSHRKPVWRDGYDGIAQLFLVAMLGSRHEVGEAKI